MDKAFENCPKECPLENDSKWLAEKASEIMKKLELERTKLKLQLEKVLEAIGEGVPCPNAANLPVIDIRCSEFDCKECWGIQHRWW